MSAAGVNGHSSLKSPTAEQAQLRVEQHALHTSCLAGNWKQKMGKWKACEELYKLTEFFSPEESHEIQNGAIRLAVVKEFL